MDIEKARKRYRDCLAAIEAHEKGEPVEFFSVHGKWLDTLGVPLWCNGAHYRPRRLPREGWAVYYPGSAEDDPWDAVYPTRERAERYASGGIIIKVREVEESEEIDGN